MRDLRTIYITIISLLVTLCTYTTVAAQATPHTTDSIASSRKAGDKMPIAPHRDTKMQIGDTLHVLSAREIQAITLGDSLHHATKAELGISPTGEGDSENTGQATGTDSLKAAKASRRELRQQRLASFTPDPGKATWTALVFPGGGQIYNHKYWKLPIVYGGFLGCAYALNWNNQMYSDYSQAYLDIMDDDPGTASYEDFLPPRYNVEANREYLERVFKSRKDNYRRYRDMSIFCFIGVYLISVVDAYVDAELSNFDISEDLSVQVRPSIIDHQRHATPRNTQSYGLQCSFSF